MSVLLLRRSEKSSAFVSELACMATLSEQVYDSTSRGKTILNLSTKGEKVIVAISLSFKSTWQGSLRHAFLVLLIVLLILGQILRGLPIFVSSSPFFGLQDEMPN